MNYIESDSLKKSYVQRLIETKPCVILQGSDTIKLPSENVVLDINVAQYFVASKPLITLCDILKKRYRVEESCNVVIGLDKPIAIHVSDSINTEFSNYELNQLKTNPLLVNNRNKKDGLVVFFSNTYKNTLYAELKYFCQPYDEIDYWSGSSLVYFFEFENGKIKDVYMGRRHYQ